MLPDNAFGEDLISRWALSTITLVLSTVIWNIKKSFLGTTISTEVVVALSTSLMSCHLFKDFFVLFFATFHYSRFLSPFSA